MWSNLAHEMTAEFRGLCAEETYLQQELEKLQDMRNKAKMEGELWDDRMSSSSGQNSHLVSKATRLWSEIHENMNCSRCRMCVEDSIDNVRDTEAAESSSPGEACEVNQDDIGGFAALCGLHNLKSSDKQLGAPLEEDLGSWGHHFSSTSVPDEIFQASAGDETSPALSKTPRSGSIKLSRTSPKSTLLVPTKPRSTPGNRLPLKRVSTGSVQHDDDFM